MIERTTRVDASAEEVFAWHLRPGAFERLLPPWEHAVVVGRSESVAEGSTVELRIRTGPVPIRWVSVHRGIVPGREFRDEQVEGPFAHWVHTHRFEPDGPASCRLTDHIELELPFGAAGAPAASLVRRRIERMLAYRHAVLAADLASHRRYAATGPLHIAVTGSSGLLGSALIPYLTTGGHRVTRVVRRAPRDGEIAWDPDTGRIDRAGFEGIDAVVHLAGENLAGARWTEARKRRLVTSRTVGTRVLAEALAGMARPPRVLVTASAVGIYGDRGEEVLDESSLPGTGFLADLVRSWERAAEPARDAGIRVVHPRTGVVLTPAGGALARLLPPFRAGVGGPIGNGRQWASYLSIDDYVGMIHHALAVEALQGPANFVGPHPVTNLGFTRALGRALHRPALVPVPAVALRLVLGGLADEALLASQRVVPGRLAATGYVFRHPTVPAALAHVLGALPAA